jgi:hypothetical protein
MASAFALIAAAISGVFAWALLRGWRRNGRLQDLAWGISLAMYAAASLMVAAGATFGWSAGIYRLFWITGAVLTVPWLALGSVALGAGRAVRWIATALVAALHPVALYALLDGSLAEGAFKRLTPDGMVEASKKIPRGAEAWGDSLALTLGRWASIVGWVVVVAIAVWTSRARKGLTPPRSRVQANMLISVGVSIVAIGGFALGRVGQGEAFSIALALGVAVMYAGFRLAGRAPRYTVTDPGASPT